MLQELQPEGVAGTPRGRGGGAEGGKYKHLGGAPVLRFLCRGD